MRTVKRVDHEQMRRSLLEATVRVIAQYGIEGCTSKRIAQESQLNEAYIFRYYDDLRELRSKAFYTVYDNWCRNLGVIGQKYADCMKDESEKKSCIAELLTTVFGSPDEALFYMRYYYSGEYGKETFDAESSCCRQILEKYDLQTKRENELIRSIRVSIVAMAEYVIAVTRGLMSRDDESFETLYSVVTKQFSRI